MTASTSANELLGRATQKVRRHWLLLSILAAVLVLYAVGGFFLVPRLAKSQLQAYVTQTMHRQVKLGELSFNPFTFEVRAADFDLREADGTPLIAFKRLVVNAELASIWQRAINLKEVRLDAPDVQLVIDHEGKINLAQLAPPADTSKPVDTTAPPTAPPRVRIGLLAVTSGRVGVEDRTPNKPFTTALTPIQFTLTEFKTDLDYENLYKFSAVTLAGEQLDWSGQFTVQPLGSNGQFDIRQLKAATIDSYLEESLPFKLASGDMALVGRYRMAIQPALTLDVVLSKIAVRELSVAERKPDSAPLITLPSVDVEGVEMSYARRSVTLKKVALNGARIDLQREADGSLNLSRLMKSASHETSVVTTPSSVTPTPSPTPAPAPWQIGVESIQVTESAVNVVDNAVTPAAHFELQPITLTVDRWSTSQDATVHLDTDIGIDKQGKLTAQGDIRLTPLNAKVNFTLDNFALPSIQSYVKQSAQLTLHTGSLHVQGDLAYAGEPKAAPPFKFAGDVHVDNLKTTDTLGNEDFVKWQRLAVGGINFTSNPDRLAIEKIVVREPYARVMIAADQTTNVSHVLSASGNGNSSTVDVSAETQQSSPPVATQAASKASSSKSDGKAMPMRIKSVQVIDGSVNFADFSVQPSFATGIVDLNGTVIGLSSDPTSRAQVTLAGKVDRYAPVDISGEVNVLAAAKYTDIALKFANMELTTFNPYSGKFAGYSISKGKLSTELRYRVEDRKLDAQHHIVIDNLEFGAKTDSKDAAPIPLKLAIALLKDSKGVIDLNLPVGGSLDDPKFRIAPIVWQALIGVLKKIAMAPFAAIGALFGGGDELAYVEFDPGSSVLSAIEGEKLSKVAQGLVERPELKLNIPITTIDPRDGDALAQKALQTLLPPALVGTSDDPATKPQRVAVFEAALKKSTGSAVVYPLSDPTLPKPDAAAQLDAKLSYLQQELLKALKPDASALDALARERANVVQAAVLANTAVDAQRVFLTSEKAKKSEQGAAVRAVRMEMELE